MTTQWAPGLLWEWGFQQTALAFPAPLLVVAQLAAMLLPRQPGTPRGWEG